MRVVSDDLNDQVASTSQGDTIQASVFRGGALVADQLLVQSFAFSWDVSRQVQGQCTLTVADPDGSLSPWGMGDPLSPGGSRVSLTWVSGTPTSLGGILWVPLGTWRIRKADPKEQWRVYGTSSGPVRISGGASVTLDLDEDIPSTARLCRIDGDTVTAGASALTELRRLLREIGAVDTTLAPTDVTIPGAYAAWPESRLDAVDNLLDMVLGVGRCGPDGSLQVIPKAGVGPVWTIQGGDTGALVEVSRSLSDEGVYNAVTSKSTAAADGSAVVGRTYLPTGPLAWGGPFGKVPIFHQSIATTQTGVNRDAVTYLSTQIASGTIDLPVQCLAHPGIQPHDLVTVVAPTVAGDVPLVGRVVTMSWSSAQSDAGSIPGKSMSLMVRVTAEALATVAAQVARV